MAINFNWFIKINRSFGFGFQNQHITKPKVRLIIIENRSKQRFIPDQIKEHFGLLTSTHSLTIVFFLYVNIMLIVYNVSGTIWAWPSRDLDMFFFIFLCRERHLLMLYVAILGHADLWIFSVSASYRVRPYRVENSIDPREISIAPLLCWASFRLTVRSTLGKSIQP